MERRGRTLSVRFMTRVALLLAVTLAVQAMRLPSPFTGPLVNLMLILSVSLAGVAAGVGIGLLTPWVALLLGILPPVLAPAIPFIMAGNGVYCFVFGMLCGRFRGGSLAGVALASLLKFAIIAGAARFLLELPPPVSAVLLFPQLVNALLGGYASLFLAHLLQVRLSSAGEV